MVAMALTISGKESILITKHSTPTALPLLAGQTYLWAWYLAVFRALDEENWQHLALLWQAGLTVTLSVKVGLSDHDAALYSIRLSEIRKSSDR